MIVTWYQLIDLEDCLETPVFKTCRTIPSINDVLGSFLLIKSIQPYSYNMASPTCPHFCSLLLLLVLLPLLPTVFTYSEVDCLPLKSPVLVQDKPPEPWLSRSHEFALGFSDKKMMMNLII